MTLPKGLKLKGQIGRSGRVLMLNDECLLSGANLNDVQNAKWHIESFVEALNKLGYEIKKKE